MNRNHISVSLRRAGSRLFFHSAGVIAILVLLAWSAPAQEMRAIAGKVIDDEGRAIPDVTVTVKSRPQVTSTTDSDGQFSITATEVDTLLLTHIGYEAREVLVGRQTILTVVMTASASMMDEIAVVGYGTQRKITVTGAQSTLSVSELERSSTPSLSNAIAGKMPGVITRQSSGEPGADAAQVYIRGLSTFGSNSPLILIDGVERDMNQINAEEIESFTILKDASATAVYGVRGANGVIIINTKRGKVGKPEIAFRTETASLTALRLPKYITGGEYAGLMNEARSFQGLEPRWSDAEIDKFFNQTDPYLYPDADWTEAVLNTRTWQTINNLSVTGGSEIIKYYTNVGYTVQNGIYKQDSANKYNTNANIKRYNFRSNVDVNLSKNLTMQLGIGGIIRNGNYPGASSGQIFDMLRIISPVAYPVRNPDGTPGGASTYIGGNPWGLTTQSGYSTQDHTTLQATFGSQWDLSSILLEGLSVRGLFSYDRYALTNNIRAKAFEVKRYLGKDPETGEDRYSTPFREEQPLGYATANAANRAIYMEGQVNFERSFDAHYLTAMVLYNQRDYVDLTAGSSIQNLPFRKQGVSGRLTYAFDDRYLAEINFGYNGSENFPKGSRFGFFPAFSAGWIVSNESFWNWNPVSHLKIRGSHGKVGNDQIGQRFLFLNTINTAGQSYMFGPDQQLYYGMEENQIGNDRITWERATKTNIGIDLGLLNDKVTLQVDAFGEYRSGILMQRSTVPDVVGFFPWSIPYANIGVMKNKGLDALLEIRNATASGWMYTFRGNFTFAKNEIVENDEPARRYPYLSSRGLALGTHHTYIAEGFFEDEADIKAWPHQTFSVVRPGDVKYRDINSDGVIDSYDRVPVGYPRLPQISFGFGGTVAYKWIDFSAYFTGAAQSSIFLSGYSMWPFYDGEGVNNVLREYYDNRWTPGRTDAQYPAIDRGNNPNNFVNSTIWLRNGNYLRLRNAEIGFNLPESAVKRLHVKDVRLFVNGMNLYTWDHVKIIDPESNDGTGGYPLQRSFNFGVQINFN